MIFTESRHKVLVETGQRQVPLSRISPLHECCPSSPTGLYTGLTIKAISNEPSDCRNTPFEKKKNKIFGLYEISYRLPSEWLKAGSWWQPKGRALRARLLMRSVVRFHLIGCKRALR